MAVRNVSELVELARSQGFNGNIQSKDQIELAVRVFDEYVKQNIEFDFQAMTLELARMDKKIGVNPRAAAFKRDSFFDIKEDGKAHVVCGSISGVADAYFKELGIPTDFVYGSIPYQDKMPGHRWNVISDGKNNTMVDFTLSLIAEKAKTNPQYREYMNEVLSGNINPIFFSEPANGIKYGGFSIKDGVRVVDSSTLTDSFEEYVSSNGLRGVDQSLPMVNGTDALSNDMDELMLNQEMTEEEKKTEEELAKEHIDEIVSDISNRSFSGEPAEVAIQKINLLDQYLVSHLDFTETKRNKFYDDSALVNDEAISSKIINSAFRVNPDTGKSLASSEAISCIARRVLNELGIKCDYINGHVDGTAHRWNIVSVDGKNYMLDFSASIIQEHLGEVGYDAAIRHFLPNDANKKQANSYLFMDGLELKNQTYGGYQEVSELGGTSLVSKGEGDTANFENYRKNYAGTLSEVGRVDGISSFSHEDLQKMGLEKGSLEEEQENVMYADINEDTYKQYSKLLEDNDATLTDEQRSFLNDMASQLAGAQPESDDEEFVASEDTNNLSFDLTDEERQLLEEVYANNKDLRAMKGLEGMAYDGSNTLSNDKSKVLTLRKDGFITGVVLVFAISFSMSLIGMLLLNFIRG